MTFIWATVPLLIKGCVNTIALSLCAMSIGLCGGTLIGILLARKLRQPMIAPILELYIFSIRGIPFLVQLLIIYFVIPDLIGIMLSPFVAGVLSLGNCAMAHIAEVVRAGINTIPTGQWEASEALGYTRCSAMRHIIIPQVMIHVSPDLFNKLVSVILSTSVISHIGTTELTKVGSNIIAQEMNPLPVYLLIALLYLSITTVVSFLGKYIERRLHHDDCT